MSNKEYKHSEFLKESDLISLLSIYNDRLSSINQIFTSYITIFLSAIFVVLGAAVVGMSSKLELEIELIVVCSSCILTILLSFGLQATCKRTRKDCLQTIAKMVIVEEKLGLDNNKMYNSEFWKNDSIVLEEHIASRDGTKTIKNFIDINMNKGQYSNIYIISIFVYIVSAMIILLEVYRLLMLN